MRTTTALLALLALGAAAAAGCNLALGLGGYCYDDATCHSEHPDGGGGSTTSSTGTGGTGGGGPRGGEPVWVKSFGGAGQQTLGGLAVNEDGIYIAGTTAGLSDFGGNCPAMDVGPTPVAFLARLDDKGLCKVVLYLTATKSIDVNALALDGAGHVVVAGTFDGLLTPPTGVQLSASGRDAFIFSYGTDLAKLAWSGVVSGTGTDEIVNGISSAGGGAIYVVGSTSQLAYLEVQGGSSPIQPPLSPPNVGVGFIAQISSDGSAKLQPAYGTMGKTAFTDISVEPTTGRIALAGQTDGSLTVPTTQPMPTLTSQGGGDVFLLQFSTPFTMLSSNGIYGDTAEQRAGRVSAVDEYTYLTGTFHGTLDKLTPTPPNSPGGFDVFLAQIDPKGNAQHVLAFGTNTNPDETVAGVIADASGAVIAGGLSGPVTLKIDGTPFANLTSLGDVDIYVFKTKPTFDKLAWRQTFGRAGSTQAADAIALGPSGDVFIAGHFVTTLDLLSEPIKSKGLQDIFVAKLVP
jgi:hypothetical protein